MCSDFVRRLIGGTVLLVVLATPFPCGAKDAPVSLSDNLGHLVLKFDCEFTVENTYTKNPNPHDISYPRATTPKAVPRPLPEREDEIPKFLMEMFPSVSVKRHAPGSRVFRIVDRQLIGRRNYAMEQRISGHFEGTPTEVLWQMAKHVPGLQPRDPRGVIMVKEPPRAGYKASFESTYRDDTVYSAIMDQIDLSQIGGVYVETDLKSMSTEVLISPPSRDYVVREGEPKFDVDFKHGMVAFDCNPDNEKSEAAALAYIEQELAKTDEAPLKVRWAMRFLGHHKRTAAIPALMKHLDYRYTCSHNVKSCHPAFEALSQMGDDTLTAVLKVIPQETDPLRLELLLRLIIATRGGVVGPAEIDELLQAERSPTRRKLLESASRKARQPFRCDKLVPAAI